METASRPPPEDDTLALVPRDLRGTSAGVAPNMRWVATRLPHHATVVVSAAERFDATGEWPVSLPSTGGVRCVPARAGRTPLLRADVTVHEPTVTSVQDCMEPQMCLPGASVDQTNGT
jgi:hypothetical protein